MGSKRLPGKVLKILGKKTVLEQVISRVQQSKLIDDLVIATSLEPDDDVLYENCRTLNVKCFRGEHENVLSRYASAAKKLSADIIVRITADCPLISPEVIDRVIELRNSISADYASNTIVRTFPHGLDVECFTFSSLESANNLATSSYNREHVTPFIYEHPEIFKLSSYSYKSNYSEFRLTLDTNSDYRFLAKFFELKPELGTSNFNWKNMVEFIAQSNELKMLHEISKRDALLIGLDHYAES